MGQVHKFCLNVKKQMRCTLSIFQPQVFTKIVHIFNEICLNFSTIILFLFKIAFELCIFQKNILIFTIIF